MKIKLIVFDMAGTTVHDEDYVNIALREALKSEGYEVSKREVDDVMGMAKPIAIELLLKIKENNQAKITADYVDKIYTCFLNKMIEFYSTSTLIKEIEGASTTFKKLKQMGIMIGIDTGFSRPIADAIFNRLNWSNENLIDYTITSDEVEKGRPYPDMIYSTMKHLNIKDVKQVAKVGDTPADLNEGNNAGVAMNIGVLSGSYKKEELEQHPHTHILQSINELPQLLESIH